MNTRFMTAVLTATSILTSASSVFAVDDFGFLSRGEKKAYHACLYAQFIGDYCRTHAWGFSTYSFRDCVIANGACGCSIVNRGYWGPAIDDACRAALPPHHL
jgi:hypothetical protein